MIPVSFNNLRLLSHNSIRFTSPKSNIHQPPTCKRVSSFHLALPNVCLSVFDNCFTFFLQKPDISLILFLSSQVSLVSFLFLWKFRVGFNPPFVTLYFPRSSTRDLLRSSSLLHLDVHSPSRFTSEHISRAY